MVRPVSVTDWLFCLYIAGVAACLLWFFLSYLMLRRQVVEGRTRTGRRWSGWKRWPLSTI